MIKQGYVPETCTLHENLAGLLIWSEVLMGRDPCAGCYEDRAVCKGRPNLVALKKSLGPGPENDLLRAARENANRDEIREHEARLAEERARLAEEDKIFGHIHGIHEIIDDKELK